MLFRNSAEQLLRVAVFPGAYNPPTVAHVAIAAQGLTWADEVLWVVPRSFPHKEFGGPNLRERAGMIEEIARAKRGFSIGISSGGLYAEIAREAQQWYGSAIEIGLLCGRDAAERMENWDYGAEGIFDQLVARHPLLVAGRHGEYDSRSEHRDRVIPIALEDGFSDISSTEVRRRIRSGRSWEELVPAEIRAMVGRLYRVNSSE